MGAGKFRLLQAQVLFSESSSKLVLTTLQDAPSWVFADCEISARRYLWEAVAYDRLQRDAEAETSLQAGERQCAVPSPLLSADIATMRAIIEDDWKTAETDYRTALTLSRQQHDTFREAAALLNLGHATQQQEHYDESIEWSRASAELCTKMGYRIYQEKAEGNLAWDYYKVGDFDRALSLYSETERQARVLGAGYEQVRWLNNLGLVYEDRGQLAIAKEDYEKALALSRQMEDRNQTTIALIELAFVSVKIDAPDKGNVYASQALDLAKQADDRPLELAALLAQGMIASSRDQHEAAERILAEVARDPGHDRRSVQWEAQSSLADLYDKEQRTDAANAEYRVALDTLRQARCDIHHEELRMPFLANANRVYDSYIDFLIQHGKTVEALKTADESRALTLAEGLGIGGQNCLAAESRLDPQRLAKQRDATILFYWLGPRHSYLWAITPRQMQVFSLPPADEIARTAQGYRKALLGPGDALERGNGDGSKLYQVLVSPAARLVNGASRVIVIADSVLNGLNFETLLAPQPKLHYWIDDVTVINAPSLRILQSDTQPGNRRHTVQRGASPKLLLIGDAISSGGQFGQLPNAATEIEGVEKYFQPDYLQDYRRERATPQAYLGSNPEQFAYIHFVAHGTANLMSPLDSAVVLSQPADPGGSFKLYARDIIQHPLRADLVTISTCYGAGARTYTGEGLVGLSWAFLRAGAHNVIGALWEVSDSSTPQLMDRMYGELNRGSAPDAALRTAKLSLLHSPGPYRKPYYWAPFQLYTGWSQLPAK